MKKLSLIILVVVGFLLVENLGPVWLQRLVGFSGHSDKAYYPQWIDNDEYCYLRVESFFDGSVGFSAISPDFFNPLKFFRGPNATFYIYKVNIGYPNEKKLIRKITMKVDFQIPEEYQKIPERDAFIFRRLDNGELILFIRAHFRYIAYYIDTNGRVLREQVFDYEHKDADLIVDISNDNSKLLMKKYNDLYIRDIRTNKIDIFSKSQLYHYDYAKWIGANSIVIYRIFHFYADRQSEQDKYEIYITDEAGKNTKMIYSASYEDFEDVKSLLLDAALSCEQNLIFLNKIGLFREQNNTWQMTRNFKDKEFNFFYPDVSPDGKRLIGVLDDKNLKVIEVKELLKD